MAAALARPGLGQLTALAPKPPIRCYERRRPGDLVHPGIKPPACFDQPRHRLTGSRRGQNSKAGLEHVHVCIDGHARAAHVGVLHEQTGDTGARFLARAAVWFAQQGITMRRLMTDHRPQRGRSVAAAAGAERQRGAPAIAAAGCARPGRHGGGTTC